MRHVHIFSNPSGDEFESDYAFCVEPHAQKSFIVFHSLPIVVGPLRHLACAACGESEVPRTTLH